MTPERAKKLMWKENQSWGVASCRKLGRSPELVSKWDAVPRMTEEERTEIKRIWKTLPGNTCMMDVLRMIAHGEIQPTESQHAEMLWQDFQNGTYPGGDERND